MARRLHIESGVGPAALRPTAAPVDTFVQVNPSGRAAQLARSLQQLSPQLTGMALGHLDRHNEEQRKEGERHALRLSEQKKTYDQAVSEGLIPRSANPFFVAGVKEQFGRVMAAKFGSDMRAAIMSDENLRNSTNIADFDQFVQDKTEEWLEANVPAGQRDAFFDAGFQQIVQQRLDGLREQFAAQIGSNIERLGNEAMAGEVSGIVDRMAQGEIDRATAVSEVQLLVDTAIQQQGRNGTQVMRIVADQIATIAADPEVLSYDVLELLKDLRGKDGPYHGTSFGRKLYNDTRTAITEGIRRRRILQEEERQRAVEDRSRELATQGLELLRENPHANLTALMQAGDPPEALQDLQRLQQSWSSLAVKDDPETERNLAARIFDPGQRTPSIREVQRAMEAGMLTADTGIRFMSYIDSRIRADRAEANAKDPAVRALSDHGYLQESALMGQRMETLLPATLVDKAQRVANAQAKLGMWWVEFNRNDNGKTPWERRRELLNQQAAKFVEEEFPQEYNFQLSGRGPLGSADRSMNAPARQQPAAQSGGFTLNTGQQQPALSRAEVQRFRADVVKGQWSPQAQSAMQRLGVTPGEFAEMVLEGARYYNQNP